LRANKLGEFPRCLPWALVNAAGEVFQTHPQTRNSRRVPIRLRSKEGGTSVDEVSERLLKAIDECERVAEAATPDEAARTFDEATLQVFWQRWPNVSSWAGALWRRLNEDLADPAKPLEDSEFHEIGGEGG